MSLWTDTIGETAHVYVVNADYKVTLSMWSHKHKSTLKLMSQFAIERTMYVYGSTSPKKTPLYWGDTCWLKWNEYYFHCVVFTGAAAAQSGQG